MGVKRALISVSDKTGIVEFARGLHELGVEIISTGGSRDSRQIGFGNYGISGNDGRPCKNTASENTWRDFGNPR